MQAEKIIFPDDPEAATLQTVTGWVSRNGQFFGSDERIARYAGSTHARCEECGGTASKGWLVCDDCKGKRDAAKYAALERKKWDGEAMLYSDLKDRYYTDLSQADDDLEDGESLEKLMLRICEPNYPRQIDDDYFCDEMTEDGDLPDDLVAAMDAFNEVVKKSKPLSWSPGDYAVDLSE
jgi:hypothetical protein